MASFREILSTFSDDQTTRGDQFAVLCKWLLETDPIYANKLKKVWMWDDWPPRWVPEDNWGPDAGIDLIAEDQEGKTWAIQAKCYDEIYQVKKQDIDSFISESSNDQIDCRLLIATTDKVARAAVNVIRRAPDDKPIQQLLLTELLEKQLVWPQTLEDLSLAGPRERFGPRPHQENAIEDIIHGFKSHDRGQMIMACGTGKTLTGLWVAEELRFEKVLVLFPSLLLLSKTLADWLRHSKEPFSYLPVCSDNSVIKSSADAINFTTSDLSFPSTTDKTEIAKFLKGKGRKVIFSTYQSSPQIAEAYESAKELKPLDLIICDEAHRCAGNAELDYTTALDNERIPASKRLFMTATPKVFKPYIIKRAAESGIEVTSMDDVGKFGPELHKLSFGEAIEKELLTDYQVVIVGVDNELYSDMISERSLVQTHNKIESDAQSFASHVGLAKAIDSYDLRRVITFHSRVNSAKEFQKDFPDVVDWMPPTSRPSGKFVANYVSGAMSTGQRNQNLRRLGELEEGERALLANARCLLEGVDVPSLDGVAFIDPRNSEIEIVQAVGRAIRLSSAKDVGTIIIPIFIRDYEDPDEVLSDSVFKKVWAVVNALRSHDEGLGIELDNLRKALGKRGSVGKSDKIHFDLPVQISSAFEKALSVRLIESTTASWEFWYGLLERYKEEFGDCLVPASFEHSGVKLGIWVAGQRSKKDELTEDQVARLNSLGFVWDALTHQWEQAFKALVAYKKKYGDCLVPQSFEHSGVKLGIWVAGQRSKKDQLTEDQVARLDALGFSWEPYSEQWEEFFLALVAYKKEYGDCLVPRGFQYNGLMLGDWVKTQRSPRILMSQDRIDRLNSLGFIWDPRTALWEQAFLALVAYKEKNGDCLVPPSFEHSGVKLGSWVIRQRSKKDQLTEDQVARLNSLGFIWDAFTHQWEQAFLALVAYKKEYGDCLVPRGFQYSGLNLGDWVKTQRTRKALMSQDRIDRLNSLGFIWDPHAAQWEKLFLALVAYKKKYGDCRVPVKLKFQGVGLGRWVSRQRDIKDRLSAEQIARLDALDFLWTTDPNC